RRGEEGVGWNDDLVAGTDAVGREGEDERVRSRVDAHDVVDAEVAGERALELADLGPEDGLPVEQHAPDALEQIVDQRGVLTREIDVGDRRGRRAQANRLQKSRSADIRATLR